MRVLVTGGTGFVGTNLARRLVHDGHTVTLLLRPRSDRWRIRDMNVPILLADLSNPRDALEVVNQVRPDWIFHLAQHGGYPWQTSMAEIAKTNLLSSANLLEAALMVGFGAFINTGTSTEYGPKDHAPVEDEPLEPRGAYAASKATFTLACEDKRQKTGAHISTLRLYSVYGPWEHPRRFIPNLVARGLEGNFPPLADPLTARDYVYINDVVDAYLLAVTAPPATYNVGTGVQTTLERAVALARDLFRIREEPEWGSLADRSWDTATWVANPARLEAQGWKAKVSFDQGLRMTAKWMVDHPELGVRYRARARLTESAIPGPSSPIRPSR